ncbi:MAG: methanol--corrinoid methyltransferase [Armatimonadetes bacterium]|nr:methanol--corrinoid methyltransferase [Armatimonadota bacterium]
MQFKTLAIGEADRLIFGRAIRPLQTRRGLTIGGGEVYPELNFTLPAMQVNDTTWSEVETHYREIIAGALERAVELHAPGLVIECETLPAMTQQPARAIAVCHILTDAMEEAWRKEGLRSALRMTPNDNREMIRPPLMRSGPEWEAMLETFEGCASASADLLSIESTGGKEVHDDALTMCDLPQVIFALCVMGVRDMRFLWEHIVAVAGRHDGVHAAGDTACGFANTAMVLAEKNMIPRVFAAVVRAVSAVCSLVAYECGAEGPGKDCAYENPYLKAVTGLPMSMEGKCAACAHLSPLGNIAAATCDLWSNESVQNIRLLGGMAPTVSLEHLVYDCRLMNRASAKGPEAARDLRDLLVASDAPLDPHAFILTPESIIAVAETIVTAGSPYEAGCRVALKAIELLREAGASGATIVTGREAPWLDRMQDAVAALPDDEGNFIEQMMGSVDTSKFIAADYGLA